MQRPRARRDEDMDAEPGRMADKVRKWDAMAIADSVVLE
jgi:hypothetical protein